MKFKFNLSKLKVEPKDLAIFIGFCILLLYLVAGKKSGENASNGIKP